MTAHSFRRMPMIESLEQRTFLSVAPVTAHAASPVPKAAASYNLMRLNGYDLRGATWKYSTTGVVSVGSDRQSVSASTTMTVARTTAAYDGHSCNLVASSGGKTATTKVAWYTDAGGTFATAQIVGTDMGQFNMRLHDSRVAPAAMKFKQAYSDTGSFDGTFNGGVSGQRVTGTVSGTDSVGSQLVGQETITVPAGTFNAIKGVWTLKLTGQMTLHASGESIDAKFVMSGTNTFWAVPGKGIVKNIASMKINVSISGQGSVAVNLTGTSVMTSFTAGSVKSAVRSAKPGLFADDRPVV